MVEHEETRIDITPDDKIFTPKGVGALNIGVVECLSELVANSLDWRRYNEVEIENIKKDIQGDIDPQLKVVYSNIVNLGPVDPIVEIRYDKKSISVKDNGVGMTINELETGLKLRAATDYKRVPLRVRKGMFGMGMKVGMFGIGWKFTIYTRSIIEKNKEHVLEIDTRKIEEGKLHLKDIKVKTMEHNKKGPLRDQDSGTYISIEDLHKSIHDPITWREKLAISFQPEIVYNNVKIIIADATRRKEVRMEPAKAEGIPIIAETKIILDDYDLKVKIDNGDGTRGDALKIKGWLALRKKSGSGSGIWGVHTFRKGQLIEAFHHDGPTNNGLLPKKPHPTLARLHGEIHLDMCDPNFTKVGWNRELKSWRDAKEKLRPYLDEILKASKNYKVSDKAQSAKTIRGIQKFKQQSDSTINALTSQEKNEDSCKQDQNESDGDYLKLPEGKKLLISVTHQEFLGKGHVTKFWKYVYRHESGELAVFVDTNSYMWKGAEVSKDTDKMFEMIVNWAVIDSLYFCLIDDMGYDCNTAMTLRDEWMSKCYSPG